MAESETETRGPERPNKPALPPFGGPGAAAGPVLRPSTDLRGRKTLPPFFAPPVRVGGPLPGAAPRPSVRPGLMAAPEAQAVVAAPEPVETRSETVTPARSITPPAPSWDTPPMPVAVTVATLAGPDVGGDAGVATRPTVEAEWTSPLSDPRARPAVEETPVEAPSVFSAPAADVVPPKDVYEPEGSPDPEYATTAHEPVVLEGPAALSVPDTQEPVSLELADKAEADKAESEAQPPALPPTPFEDAPLSALQGTASDASRPAPECRVWREVGRHNRHVRRTLHWATSSTPARRRCGSPRECAGDSAPLCPQNAAAWDRASGTRRAGRRPRTGGSTHWTEGHAGPVASDYADERAHDSADPDGSVDRRREGAGLATQCGSGRGAVTNADRRPRPAGHRGLACGCARTGNGRGARSRRADRDRGTDPDR